MFFSSLFKIKFNILFVCFRCLLIFISFVVCEYPKQIRKFFSVVIFLFLTACAQDGEGNPPIEQVRAKRLDPVKQDECKERGRSGCEADKDCEEICDDIFSSRRSRQECYEYSSEMVSQFEDLIEAAEDGEVDEIEGIGPDVLECMLDIDESAFAKAVKEMSRREAQDFAVLIAGDVGFAEVLEEEDDEFNILRQLVNRLAGGSGLEEVLSQEIEDDKTLLWLFAEGNKGAWDWLDNYVAEECDGRNSEDCPGGENIGVYCNALLESNFRSSDWDDFLSKTELFAKMYEYDVKDEGYEYEITDSPGSDYDGDFRDYCELKADASGSNTPSDPPDDSNPPVVTPPSLTPCPTGSPEAGQILANFQLETINTQSRLYSRPNFFPSSHGSVTPSQDIVLRIVVDIRASYDEPYNILFRDNQISFNSSRTYYIYIDNTRIELNVGHSGVQGGIRYRAVTARNYPTSGRLESFDLAVASELNGDQCEFYTP